MLPKSRFLGVFARVRGHFSCGEKSEKGKDGASISFRRSLIFDPKFLKGARGELFSKSFPRSRSFSSSQHFLQKLTRIRCRVLCHLLGGTRGDDSAAAVTALGAEVDDMVCRFDDVEVMLDDDD